MDKIIQAIKERFGDDIVNDERDSSGTQYFVIEVDGVEYSLSIEELDY